VKKLLFICLLLLTILLPVQIEAQTPVTVNINPPTAGVNPNVDVGIILTNALTILFFVAALVVVFMVVLGAFQWITAGGDKDSLGKARERITQALIGFVILALAWLIVKVVGDFININVTNINKLPTLDQQCQDKTKVFNPQTGQCDLPRCVTPLKFDSTTNSCKP